MVRFTWHHLHFFSTPSLSFFIFCDEPDLVASVVELPWGVVTVGVVDAALVVGPALTVDQLTQGEFLALPLGLVKVAPTFPEQRLLGSNKDSDSSLGYAWIRQRVTFSTDFIASIVGTYYTVINHKK